MKHHTPPLEMIERQTVTRPYSLENLPVEGAAAELFAEMDVNKIGVTDPTGNVYILFEIRGVGTAVLINDKEGSAEVEWTAMPELLERQGVNLDDLEELLIAIFDEVARYR